MAETRTVHDPFQGKDVQISDRLVDRLRGKYASGPHLPNGNPEFGWLQFQSPPIQHEAANRIEELEACIRGLVDHGFPEHSAVRRRELEKGIGSATDGGRAWTAAFAAIGKPVKTKVKQ